jgi:hypothetical protein
MNRTSSPVKMNATTIRDPRLLAKPSEQARAATPPTPIDVQPTRVTIPALQDCFQGYLHAGPQLALSLFEKHQAEKQLSALRKEQAFLSRFRHEYSSTNDRELALQTAEKRLARAQTESDKLQRDQSLYAQNLAKEFEAAISSNSKATDAPPAQHGEALKHLQEQMESLKSTFETKETSHEKEVEDLRTSLREQTQTILKLQKQLENFEASSTKITSIQEELSELKSSHDQRDSKSSSADIEILRNEVNDLKKRRINHDVKLNDEKTQRIGETKKLRDDADRLLEITRVLTKDFDGHARDCEDLSYDVSKARERIRLVEDDTTEALDNVKNHDDRISVLSNEVISEREYRAERLEPEIQKLQKDHQDLDGRFKVISVKLNDSVNPSLSPNEKLELYSHMEEIEKKQQQQFTTMDTRREEDMHSLKERVTAVEKRVKSVQELQENKSPIATSTSSSNAKEIREVVVSEVKKAFESATPDVSTDISGAVVMEVNKALENAAPNNREETRKEIEAAMKPLEAGLMGAVRHLMKDLESRLRDQVKDSAVSEQRDSVEATINGVARDGTDPKGIIRTLARHDGWIHENEPRPSSLQGDRVALSQHVEEHEQKSTDMLRSRSEQHSRDVSISGAASANPTTISLDASYQKLKEQVKGIQITLLATTSDISEIYNRQDDIRELQEKLRTDLHGEVIKGTALADNVEERFQEADRRFQKLDEKTEVSTEVLKTIEQKLDASAGELDRAKVAADHAASQSSKTADSVAQTTERIGQWEKAITKLQEAQAQSQQPVLPQLGTPAIQEVTMRVNNLEQGQAQLHKQIGNRNIPEALQVSLMATANLQKRFDTLMTNDLAQNMIAQLRQAQSIFDPAVLNQSIDELKRAVLDQQTRLGVVVRDVVNINTFANQTIQRMSNLEATPSIMDNAAQTNRSTSSGTESHDIIEERIKILDNNVSMVLRQLKLPNQSNNEEPSPPLREQLEADLTVIQQNLSTLHAENKEFRKKLGHLEELRINNLKRGNVGLGNAAGYLDSGDDDDG